jgi:hypothetical protein
MSRTNRLALKLVADVMNRGAARVRAITAGEQNEFGRALKDLDNLARKAQIPMALGGGQAATHYGFRGGTEDIDIVVGKDNLDKFLRYAPDFGFKVVWRSKSGWHTLDHSGIEINVIPEGGKAKDSSPTLIPGPEQLGVTEGLGVACLSGLLEMKIATGRAKDFGHIAELLKITPDAEIDTCRTHLRGVHSDYLREFERLVQQVEQEKEQEQRRGKRHL